MFNFQKLDVYPCSIELLTTMTPLLERTPKGGGISDQLRRAANSIPLNIAEATGRTGRDAQRFFLIARGSDFECAAIFDVLLATGQVDAVTIRPLLELLERIVSMLTVMGRGRV